jgi:hypothetical protein
MTLCVLARKSCGVSCTILHNRSQIRGIESVGSLVRLPFKGPESGNFAKRVISVDSQNKTHALISSCLNVVHYVSNILHGFPYTYVEVHKVLLLFLFWSFILRLHFVMRPLNVLSSCHCQGPGRTAQLIQWLGCGLAWLMGGQWSIPSGRYFSYLHNITIGSDKPVQWRTTIFLSFFPFFVGGGGGVRWLGHKPVWMPRLSTDLLHVFRMCSWLVVGTVLFCVCARARARIFAGAFILWN